MKKVTIICSLLFLGISVIAQTGKTKHKFPEAKAPHPIATHKNNDVAPVIQKGLAPTAKAVMTAIWTDDFSVSSNWTKASTTGAGIWSIGTTGPTGSFAIPAIASTTAANGFGKFDSDLDCSGSQVANITTAASINCSASPFVNLNFQQQYRRFYDSTFVYVSNNGSTWTKYPVNVALANNDFCLTNPQTVTVNISATAGGQATVWIRFQFYSPTSLGGSAGCGYAWMVDDASITPIDPNDLMMDRAYADFSYVDGGYYTQTPTTQVAPITFRGAISNIGTLAQTGVKVNVNINDGAGSVYNQNSSTLASLGYQAVDTLLITTPAFTPPSSVKTYTATFNVNQVETELASDIANNTVVKTFKVTDTVYARDNGTATGTASPNNYTGGDIDDARIGLIYEFTAAASASSISAFMESTTGVGTMVQAKLYEVAAGVFTEVAASSVVTMGTVTTGWMNFPLPVTVLNAGSTYVATIVTSGVSTGPPNLYVVLGDDGMTQQPSGVALLYLPPPDGTWYTIASLPMIRLNVVSPFAGVSEKSIAGVQLSQNMPNPTNGISSINYVLEKNAQVVLNVYDVTGKVIATQDMGSQLSGSHTAKFDAHSLSAGVYYYSLNVNNATTAAMKMVVIK